MASSPPLASAEGIRHYSLTLTAADPDHSVLSFARLAELAGRFQRIGELTLLHHLEEISGTHGRRASWLQDSIEIQLHSFSADLSTLHVAAPALKATFEGGHQLELWPSPELDALLDQDALELIMEAFGHAVADDELGPGAFLDKNLLGELSAMRRFFSTPEEALQISRHGEGVLMTLNHDLLQQIRRREQDIPPPRREIITGQLDLLKYSTAKLELLTNNQRVRARLGPDLSMDEVGPFFGRFVTIVGEAHFGPAGELSLVDVEEIRPPQKGEQFFYQRPESRDLRQEAQLQAHRKAATMPRRAIVGQWPDRRSFDELLKDLK